MKKQLNQILKEQVILEFQKKGLNDLIVFFMAKYPEFPYMELNIEQLNKDYLKVYDITFLASYIRYSDLSLLKSGIQDEEVKEKLYYLHYHIGTILPSYRKFIWSDITLEDIKRWLPLLSIYKIKNRIMKCQKITTAYQYFLDCCLDETSFAYQNLVLLDFIFPAINTEIDRIAQIKNQEVFHKLLQIVVENNISISYDELLERFFHLQKVLEQLSDFSSYQTFVVEYLRYDYTDIKISTVEDLKLFFEFVKKEKQFALEQKQDILKLKEFYSSQFLGIHYQEFHRLFDKIPNDQSKQYQLLQELENALFPLSLKGTFYQRFSECDLQEYVRNLIPKIDELNEISSKFTFPTTLKKYALVDIENQEFYFLSSLANDYEKNQDILVTTIQKDDFFSYEEGCLFGYLQPTIISRQENTCVIKKEQPNFLVAFDHVSLEHLRYQKAFNIPIAIIDTEIYAEKQVYRLEKQYASRDWESYITQKRNFFYSIKNHLWLFSKYLNREALYFDTKCLQEQIEKWTLENVSPSFIKKQIQVLEKLLVLNKELEVVFERKTSFQKNKKMLQ